MPKPKQFAPENEWCIPSEGKWSLSKQRTGPKKSQADESANEDRLQECIAQVAELQETLFADNRFSLLLVFQAMDAAGKDGTIRAVMTGINPAGCQVHSFKAPTHEELDHDFLWRVSSRLPERGRIGIFNRSHYEEVLVVKVHPEFVAGQRLPGKVDKHFWDERYDSINAWERHLASNGVVVLKFFLNVSKAEQKRRLLERIDDPNKNWKFEAGDLDTREHWDEYMKAYEEAMRRTSTPWAPWYCIPADDKDFMRRAVAETILDTLKAMPIQFPQLSAERKAQLQTQRERLVREL